MGNGDWEKAVAQREFRQTRPIFREGRSRYLTVKYLSGQCVIEKRKALSTRYSFILWIVLSTLQTTGIWASKNGWYQCLILMSLDLYDYTRKELRRSEKERHAKEKGQVMAL